MAVDNFARSMAAEALSNKTDISLLKENMEFTPRFIGRYNMPWFIEGQGAIEMALVQLNKNVFILTARGNGAPYTPQSSNPTVKVELPFKPFVDYAISPWSSPVQVSTGDGIFFMSSATYGYNTFGIVTPLDKQITSFQNVQMLIYGELIEDETTK